MSDPSKIKALRRELADLQRLLDEKEVELAFKDKMIELAEKEFGMDIKNGGSSSLPSDLTKKANSK